MPTGLGGERLWLCPSLDDSPDDISGNGYNGTYVGGMATVSDTGEGGVRAYEHDVVSKGITLPADLGMTADDGTISIWVYSDSAQSSTNIFQYIGAYDQTYTNSNPVFYTRSNKSTMADRTQSPNAIPILDVESTISYLAWKHFCLTKESGVYKVYLDGSLAATSATFTGDLSFHTTVPWAIGKGFFNSFTGMSDDARIFNRVIDQTEITYLATSRGITGSPYGTATNYSPFRNAKYINKTYHLPRFG